MNVKDFFQDTVGEERSLFSYVFTYPEHFHYRASMAWKKECILSR